MRFKSRKTIQREFLASREEQSDPDFLASCALHGDSAHLALRVRTAIANLAGVHACHIRAEDTFDGELVHFDFWGSLDSIAVVLELERSLGVAISDEQAHNIPDPESSPGITVAEWVRKVVTVVRIGCLANS